MKTIYKSYYTAYTKGKNGQDEITVLAKNHATAYGQAQNAAARLGQQVVHVVPNRK